MRGAWAIGVHAGDAKQPGAHVLRRDDDLPEQVYCLILHAVMLRA